MAIDKAKKKEIVGEIQNAFSQNISIVLVDPTGLNMSEIEEIRNKLSEKSIKFKVAKKNLIKIAEKAKGLNFEPEVYAGSLGLIIGYENEIEPIKATYNLSKQFEKLQIRGGIFEKKYVSNNFIIKIANIPSQEELYTRIVGSIAAPISGLVNVLSGNTRNLVNVLKNCQEKLS
ncbi:MAG: 50S ribosomal protein L10 [bacterium]